MGTARTELIASTAMSLIAERGLRGLTHRAVDEAAGLPPGSTSYYTRTRADLIEAALTWMAEEEEREPGRAAADPPGSADAAADLVAQFVHTALTREADRTRARLELALEASRNPGLRTLYDRLGLRLRRLAEQALHGLGSPEPQRHARVLIAWCDGMLFDSLAGSGSLRPPDRAELRAGAAELLRGLLGGAAAP